MCFDPSWWFRLHHTHAIGQNNKHDEVWKHGTDEEVDAWLSDLAFFTEEKKWFGFTEAERRALLIGGDISLSKWKTNIQVDI